MEMLYDIGLTDDNIKEILSNFPFIDNFDNEDICINIEILKQIGCKNRHIKNIILVNPGYLLESKDEIIERITWFNEKGFSCIYLLFDSNPFLLTTDKDSLDKFVCNKINEGLSLGEILLLLEDSSLDLE